MERAAPQAVRRARASNLQLLIGRNAPVRIVQSWLLIGRERACKLIFTGRFTGDVQEDKLASKYTGSVPPGVDMS